MRWDEITLWLFVAAHLICCALIFAGIRRGGLAVRRLVFWVLLMMPVWGPALALALHLQSRTKQTGVQEVEVEKFRLESELYKSIDLDAAQTSNGAVAIEEALIVNTPKERRGMVMDILNDNPRSYVEFLKMAGSNEDSEVVHYAVTAMAQISRENDQALWELEQRYAQDPNDPDTVRTYCDFLWRCLEQGLMQGHVERMNRNLFDALIRKKLTQGEPLAADYIRGIENSMLMKNYAQSGAMLKAARERWPENEELLILNIRYLADMQRPRDIQTLLDEAEEKHYYLSAKAKEVMAFWRE